MKISTLGRHIREGFKNIGRNGWMSVASILSVTVTLLILGVFLLLAMNINSITEQVENQVEIHAFIDFEATEAQIAETERRIKRIEEVESVVFIPKSEGIRNFIEGMGDEGRYFQEFENDDINPLPDSFVIQTKRPQDTAMVAERVENLTFIYKVRFGEDYIQDLFTWTSTLRNVGIAFILGLAFTAMFLIANTIKITIIARSREIEIMKLVGATNNFIRWPFFVEGLLLGIIGALIPIGLLIFGYNQLLGMVGQNENLRLFTLLPLNPLAYEIAVLLLAIGAFIGVWGSVTSVRKFLKV